MTGGKQEASRPSSTRPLHHCQSTCISRVPQLRVFEWAGGQSHCVRTMLTLTHAPVRKPQQEGTIQSFVFTWLMLIYCKTGQRAAAAELQHSKVKVNIIKWSKREMIIKDKIAQMYFKFIKIKDGEGSFLPFSFLVITYLHTNLSREMLRQAAAFSFSGFPIHLVGFTGVIVYFFLSIVIIT